MNGSHCGLAAAKPVKWLLDTNPMLQREVRMFILGRRDTDFFDVALPPTWAQRLMARVNPKAPVELPVARLFMKMTEILGDRHVEVTCSDADMDKIVDAAKASGMSFAEQVEKQQRFLATGAMS